MGPGIGTPELLVLLVTKERLPLCSKVKTKTFCYADKYTLYCCHFLYGKKEACRFTRVALLRKCKQSFLRHNLTQIPIR